MLSIRRCIVFGILLVTSIATNPQLGHALGPHGDVFVGYSQPTDFDSWGWEASAHLKVAPSVGIEGNVSGFDYGAGATTPVTYAYMVGPRVTVRVLKVRAFAHVLLGRAEPSGGNPYGNPEVSGGFLYAVGGGLDFPLISKLNWRLSGDYLNAPAEASTYPGSGKIGRISIGPVLRF